MIEKDQFPLQPQIQKQQLLGKMGRRKTLEVRKYAKSKHGVIQQKKPSRPSRKAQKKRGAVIRDLQKKDRGVEKKRVRSNGDREDSGSNVLPQPASAKQCIPAEESILVPESSGSKDFTANNVRPVIKTKTSVVTSNKPGSNKADMSTLMKESAAEGKCF